MPRKKIGALLEEKGIISEFQLVAALSHQRKWKIRLGKALQELGYIEEKQLFEVLAEQWEMELVDLYQEPPSEDAKKKLSKDQGLKLMAVPLRIEGEELVVAISEPDRENLKEELGSITGMKVRLVLAMDSQVEELAHTLPEKVSLGVVKPVKKAFRKNEKGEMEPIEEESVVLGGEEGLVQEAPEPMAEESARPQEAGGEEEPVALEPVEESAGQEEPAEEEELSLIHI